MCDRPPALAHHRPRCPGRGHRRCRRGRVEGQHRHRHLRGRLPARLARGRARRAVEPGLGGALRLARHPVSADWQADGRPHRPRRSAGLGSFAPRRARQRLRRRGRDRRGGARARADARTVGPSRAPCARRRDRRSVPPHDRLRRAGSPKRCRGAPRRTGHRLRHARRAHHPSSRRRVVARRRVRRERRRHRGRHDLAARRGRAVHDVAAAGSVLAARPRGRLEVPCDRGRRPDRREPWRLLRPDDARVAAARADRARRDDRSDRAARRGVPRRFFAAARRLVPELERRWAIKTFAANRPASEPGYRIGIDRNRPNLVHAAGIRSTGVSSVAGRRRARARDPGPGRSAGAGRAPRGRRPP